MDVVRVAAEGSVKTTHATTYLPVQWSALKVPDAFKLDVDSVSHSNSRSHT